MATSCGIDSWGPYQLHDGLPRRRSSSLSPTKQSSGPRPTKRRRVSRFFGQDSTSTNSDEGDQPLRTPRHRKPWGFLSLFTFSEALRKGFTYDRVPGHGDIRFEQERQFEEALTQGLGPYDASDPLIEPGRRRSSLARIREFFTRKRKDSGVQENFVATTSYPWDVYAGVSHVNPHQQHDVQYFNPSLEPLAMGGWLRFQNMSRDDLEAFDGPSTFYQGHTYHNRPCTIPPQSIYSKPTRADPRQWFSDRAPTPTLETNAEAEIDSNRLRWHGLSGYSPSPTWNRSHSHQSSVQLQIPTFRKGRRSIGRTTQRSARGTIYNPSPVTRNFTARGLSRRISKAQSIFWTRKFSINPRPFGKEPDLRLRSIDELGVLPLAEVSSNESLSGVPQPTFTNPSTTSSTAALYSVSVPTSADSSTPHLHTCSPTRAPGLPYLPSPTINPLNSGTSDPNSFLPLPSPQFAAPPITATRLPSMLDLVESPRWSQRTATTVSDDTSESEGLGLRRMTSSLVDALSSFYIDGEGSLGWGGNASAEPLDVQLIDGIEANNFVDGVYEEERNGED